MTASNDRRPEFHRMIEAARLVIRPTLLTGIC